MRTARLLLVALLLAAALPARGAELILAWEYPPDVTPPPESFLVTALSTTQPQQFRLPNLGQASCLGIPNLPGLTPATVCGRPPDCLAPGVYSFWVQAEQGGAVSDASNIATCEARAGCAYDCANAVVPPALQRLIDQVQGDGPVTPEQIERLLTELARPPTPVPPPNQITPVRGIDQIPDQVQAALDLLPKAPV